MDDALVEAVARAISTHENGYDAEWPFCVDQARAVIPIVAEACAKVAEEHGVTVSNERIGQACSRNIASDIRRSIRRHASLSD